MLDCVNLLKHMNLVLVKFAFQSANTLIHELAKAAYCASYVCFSICEYIDVLTYELAKIACYLLYVTY